MWKMVCKHAFSINFNINEAFNSEAEEIEMVDLSKVYELYSKYGVDGIYAFVSYKREQEMTRIFNSDAVHSDALPEFRTDNYYAAKEQLEKEEYKVS